MSHLRTIAPHKGDLFKAILSSNHPKELVRTLPAETLYLEIRKRGLTDCAEFVELASDEQCRLMADFDLWNGDTFSEDRFWEWLELPDATEDLKPLQKLLRFVDLKLVSLLISRYIAVETFEEPTDSPPSPDFYSPDKGRTWIQIQLENEHYQFLLGRLLAYIFESDAKVFYQLLSIPSVSTDSILEESSYEDKRKRLCAEGIPDDETAERMNSPLPESLVRSMLDKSNVESLALDAPIVEPLIFSQSRITLEPFGTLLRELSESERERFQQQLTRVMNGSLLYWKIPFSDTDAVKRIASATRGALNIALEKIAEISDCSPLKAYQALSVEGLYRFGLSLLFPVRTLARKIGEEREIADSIALTVLEAAQKDLPHAPAFLEELKAASEMPEKLSGEMTAIETLEDLRWIEVYLKKLDAHCS
ncbi:MAG: hypothetical protein KDD55_00215 [Bdellovibrionales bacterium]|nr:hypothetical protein [Bdellovibrionales bacterium]